MSGAASEFWTAECVRAAMGAVWHAHPRDGTDPRGGASIDTRSLAPGEIFFALRGERVDGHAYLEQAHHAGAALAVIDDAEQAGETPPGLPVVRVADARAALGRLAAAYRRRLSATRFIAVTGSNGKTTTTRMIHACLGDRLRGRCSPGSYNNDLGVPLTILAARPGDQYVICEVGANAPGEIEPLSGMIQPDVVVITSIGRAHLEGFGSIECIAREKLSLASHLAPGGVVFLCADAPHLHELAAPLKRRVTFGRSASADLRVEGILHVPGGIRFSINERAEFTLPRLGEHDAINAAAAVGVARRFGIDDETLVNALARFEGAEMRLARHQVAGIDVINDAYNANPDSMLAALRTLAAAAPAGARRVAVLGDMLEIGADGPDAHREIGLAIGADDLADAVVLVGPLAALAEAPIQRLRPKLPVSRIDSVDGEGARTVADLLRQGDTVLLKGSRGMRLERVLDAISGTSCTTAPGG